MIEDRCSHNSLVARQMSDDYNHAALEILDLGRFFMGTIQTLPAPDVAPLATSNEQWRHDRAEFQRLLPRLLKDSAGKFVAVHDGQIVACGDDKIVVAQQAYSQCGYVPIYVGHVVAEPPSPIRMPTPRSVARS